MDSYDYIVVGSGFGGSVAALRLVEKGYRVAVLEQGDRVEASRMKQASARVKQLMWLPQIGLRGFFSQRFFRHVGLIRGVGVGGGSLVYAAVLLRPKEAFFNSSAWCHLANWQQELASHYDEASRMLGVQKNPYASEMDAQLKRAATKLGCERSYGAVPQGIYFGEAGKSVSDPFFDGEGPERTGCTQCGHCISGCYVGAKNSLDKNYLYLAEKKGLEVIPRTRVQMISEAAGGGYTLLCQQGARKRKVEYRADKLVLAAGVVGTLELLFKCRDKYQTLPKLSACLGDTVRTNSEALVASISSEPDIDLTQGTTISSDFYFGDDTHITQNRIPPSQSFMRFYMGPLVDDSRPLIRALKTLWKLIRHPISSSVAWRARDWHKRATVLTVMQVIDNSLSMRWRRLWWMPWRKGLVSQVDSNKRVPAYLPKANQAARALAEESKGQALNMLGESIGNLSMTAHILGGCKIGGHAEEGVINAEHEVFGYDGIYVTDASAIPANVGVNPSLTITAMAERAMSFIPPKAEG